MPASAEETPRTRAARSSRSLAWTAAIVVALVAGGYAVMHGHGAAQDRGAAAGVDTANGNAGPLQGVGAPWGSSNAPPPNGVNPPASGPAGQNAGQNPAPRP